MVVIKRQKKNLGCWLVVLKFSSSVEEKINGYPKRVEYCVCVKVWILDSRTYQCTGWEARTCVASDERWSPTTRLYFHRYWELYCKVHTWFGDFDMCCCSYIFISCMEGAYYHAIYEIVNAKYFDGMSSRLWLVHNVQYKHLMPNIGYSKTNKTIFESSPYKCSTTPRSSKKSLGLVVGVGEAWRICHCWSPPLHRNMDTQ